MNDGVAALVICGAFVFGSVFGAATWGLAFQAAMQFLSNLQVCFEPTEIDDSNEEDDEADAWKRN